MTSVTIGNSVTSIGSSAFYNCQGLTSVTIGNSVTSIGGYAFYNCSSLTSITIPNSVTRIEKYAFAGCSGMKTIVWNAKNCHDFSNGESPFYFSYTSGGTAYAYDDIRAQITSFTFGNEVEHIPAYLCMGMKNISSITIPNRVTSIGEAAFAICSSLTSITIPNSVTSIDRWAFSDCTALKTITIGHAVETIGDNAFDVCPNVMTIYSYLETPPVINSTVFAGFGTYKGVDLYVPTGCKAKYEAKEYWKDFYIIEGLPDIIDNNLYYQLDDVNMTATLITSSLAELKPVINGELTIPDTVVSNGKTYTVTAIGNNVFKDNTTISTVVIPSSVIHIGDSAFYGSSLTSVVIGGTEQTLLATAPLRRTKQEKECYEIGKYAFANCKYLTDVQFLECVSSIGEGAFKGCSSLKTIQSMMQNPPTIDATVFAGCGELKNIVLYVPEEWIQTYLDKTIWRDFFVKVYVKTYTITFVNWDGTELLKLSDVEEGTTPEYTGTIPTRPEDESYTYTFIGWTPAIVPATSDATYTATYEETSNQAIDEINTSDAPVKILHNGHFYLLRDGKMFDVTGKEVK